MGNPPRLGNDYHLKRGGFSRLGVSCHSSRHCESCHQATVLGLLAVELHANSPRLPRSTEQPHASGRKLRVVERALSLPIGTVTMRPSSHPARRERGGKWRGNDRPRRNHGERRHVCERRQRSGFCEQHGEDINRRRVVQNHKCLLSDSGLRRAPRSRE